MASYQIIDNREITKANIDPDLSSGFDVWIKGFIEDLEARYNGTGVLAKVQLMITLDDPPNKGRRGVIG